MSAHATHVSRLTTLQASVPEGETWLLATPTHIHYLTGFMSLVPEERESFLVIDRDQAWLLQASFSPQPPVSAGLQVKMNVSPSALVDHLKAWAQTKSWQVLRVDMTQLTAIEYRAMQNAGWEPLELPKKPLWQQRLIKDADELAALKKAGQIAARCFTQLQPQLQAGMTEIDVMRRLEVLLLEVGSTKPAFPTIVAFNEHGALPHHQPTDRPLTPETAILIDFGATVEGYRSDMTRSWWYGNKPTATFTKVEELVKESYQRALAEMKIGAAIGQVDQAAREYLNKAGYGQHFIHTTGHGVGLDIHEPPSVYHPQTEEIQAGMVITVEPGIYLTDSFGYRYENTVAVTADGFQELTLETGVQ